MEHGRTWHKITGRLCFIAIGISSMADPFNIFNIYRIVLGIIAGLLFGGIYKLFMTFFLGIINSALKKEYGKKVISKIVDSATVFLVPFAVMMVMAVFYLQWSVTVGFVSAGLLAAAAAAAMETGKLSGKQELKNTLASSVVAFLFSLVWTFSYRYLLQAPAYVEGAVTLVRSLLGGGGGA